MTNEYINFIIFLEKNLATYAVIIFRKNQKNLRKI